MRITGLGHAGLRVETSGATLLVDPWFSPQGAFQGAWFPFPENARLLEDPSLRSPTAIVISHEHLDHVDPWFLSQVPANVPVIFPWTPTETLRKKIASAGPRSLVQASPWERVQVADGTSVFFVSEASPMNHDSAIVIEGDGQTLLDLNDARLFAVQLRNIRQRVGGRIDAFSFQGAGASWYPMCYGYPKVEQDRLAAKKRAAKLRYAAKCVELLEPIVALPFAGPPAFLDPELFHHNAQMEDGIFPDQAQVADFLAMRGHHCSVLLPGDSWDASLRTKELDAAWEGFTYEDRWPYLEAYARRRAGQVASVRALYPEPDVSLWEPFREYFGSLLALSSYFNRKIDMQIGFHITGAGGGHWAVDTRSGEVSVDPEPGSSSVEYTFDSRWLPPILDRRVPWEDFFLSLRFSVRRNPDLYNDHLLGLLKFAEPEALDAVQSYEESMRLDERITLNVDDRTYAVSRYCPHAGNDLKETGEVLPGGILRCLVHHYEFDVRTGKCLNGMISSLDVEPPLHQTGGPPRFDARRQVST